MQPLSPAGHYQFILPAPPLRRYLSSYYFFEIETLDGSTLDDFLHPEWMSARFMLEGDIPAAPVPHPPVSVPRASMTGPTSRAVHISCRKARLAGIGLLPLGWQKFVRADASRYANATFDLTRDPIFAPFAAIWREIEGMTDPRAMADIMDRQMLAALDPANGKETEIELVHSALADPDITDVAQLAARVGLNSQYVERLCRRVFGFPPKRLLRRQRFLRSLAPRLLDPKLKWTNVLDGSYHDQAHFSRDFRDFMGLSPRAYLNTPRPISQGALWARLEALGQPLQVLQGPKPNEG